MRKRGSKLRGRFLRHLQTITAVAAVAIVVVGSALFYVWSRHQVTSWGYRISEATTLQNELKQTNRELRLEAASLRSPDRIESIARKKLGLDFPKPGQIQPLN